MKYLTTLIFVMLVFMNSCNTTKKDYEIDLKWNKSYNEDTIERNYIALKWCLSFLGSNIASNTTVTGLSTKNDIITLQVDQLGFNKKATEYLAKLNWKLKQSEEYKNTSSINLGRYIALTIGSSYHYYNVTGIPSRLSDFKKPYTFDSITGYIDNSSISLVDRIISFSKNYKGSKQAYISAEIDSISKEIYEFETLEIMENGQLRFGIYDHNGDLKDAADNQITRAGKPAKCIWCHETGIQPIFRQQKNHKGYLSYQKLEDTLDNFNEKLSVYQDSIWKDKAIRNKRLHTEMEISYIAFMEPSVEHLSNEWGVSIKEVKQKITSLKTHRHNEFDFLGDLYHRKDIDSLAPWKVLKVPENIREKSVNEVDYLK